LTGEVGWARLSRPRAGSDVIGATPIALFLREHSAAWSALGERPLHAEAVPASPACQSVMQTLCARGALFFHELAAVTGLGDEELRAAIADLVSAGLVTSDGFAGLRAILKPGRRQSGAGRWSALVPARVMDAARESAGDDKADRSASVEIQAWALLRRYGIVFRRVLTREANAAPWRELTRIYRRLEARGELRGGRFVTGMSGEQFALPDAVERLREVRRTAPTGRLLTIGAADPLNLAGIVTSGERVRALASNRLVYRDGVPLAVLEGAFMRPLAEITVSMAAEVATALTGRPMPPVLSGYVG
jgi:ATP-dependent helicase Lhr and Lhr-like helicase